MTRSVGVFSTTTSVQRGKHRRKKEAVRGAERERERERGIAFSRLAVCELAKFALHTARSCQLPWPPSRPPWPHAWCAALPPPPSRLLAALSSRLRRHCACYRLRVPPSWYPPPLLFPIPVSILHPAPPATMSYFFVFWVIGAPCCPIALIGLGLLGPYQVKPRNLRVRIDFRVRSLMTLLMIHYEFLRCDEGQHRDVNRVWVQIFGCWEQTLC